MLQGLPDSSLNLAGRIKSLMMYYTATRLLATVAALSTLALMVHAARPWGDNYAYQDFWGYARLLLLAVWVTLPYLLLVSWPKVRFVSQPKKFLSLSAP